MGRFKPRQMVRLQGLDDVELDHELAEVKSVRQDDGRHEGFLLNDSRREIKVKTKNMVHACMHALSCCWNKEEDVLRQMQDGCVL